MNGQEFITPQKASRMLKVSLRTLQVWDTKGKLRSFRTQGNHRRFLLEDIQKIVKPNEKREGEKICYCRVSTSSQKEDLERQVEFFKGKYPTHRIIKDIGSGLNFKRKGFISILDSAVKGDISEIVVSHRDRLCRFGFELIERILSETSNGKIVVLDKQETSPEKELVDDLISIITVFSSRVYGLRDIKNSIKETLKETSSNKNNEVPTLSE